MRSLSTIVYCFASVISFSCSGTHLAPDASPWNQMFALEGAGKLGGCVIADLDPDRPGNEIGVVAGSGQVWVLSYQAGSWHGEVITTLPGEMIQCAAADLLPNQPGDELVAVGMKKGGEDQGGAGIAWLFAKEQGKWTQQVLYEDSELIHAVCLGDIDKKPGNEIVLAGYSKEISVLHYDNLQWHRTLVGTLPGPAKNVCLGPDGLWFACEDGSLVQWDPLDPSEAKTVVKLDDALARINGSSRSVLVCTNAGILHYRTANSDRQQKIADNRLRGAVILNENEVEAELATAGYDGVIYHIQVDLNKTASGQPWQVTKAACDSDKFHHLAAGELPELGSVLVGCGYSGRVTVVFQQP